MKTKFASHSAFVHPSVLLTFAFCAVGALLAFVVYASTTARAQGPQPGSIAGRLTPEETRTLAEGLKPLINDSAEGLTQVQRPDGSVSMDLEGRFQNVTVAKIEADGSVSQSCVNSLDAAADFFGIDRQTVRGASPAPATTPQELQDR